MSTYRHFYLAVAIAYIAAFAGAYFNLAYFQGEYFPNGNFIIFGTTVAASAICRLISNTHFITTTATIALSMTLGMLSGIVAHSAINSTPSLSTYDLSIYWHSLMVSLVFASAGSLLGSMCRLAQRKSAGGQHT